MRTATATVPTTSQEYGQGLFISRGRVEFGHGGTMTGYAAQLSIEDPAAFGHPQHARPRIGVVVVATGDGVNPAGLVDAGVAVANAEWRRRGGSDSTTFADTSPIPERQLTAAEAASFAGTCRNPRRFTVEVVQKGSTLTLRRFGRDFPMRAFEARPPARPRRHRAQPR